jgi:hypothetical protein
MREWAVSSHNLTFAVLNPSGSEKEATPLPLRRRISDLNSKVVYCINQHMGGANSFLKKMVDALPTLQEQDGQRKFKGGHQ